MPRYVGKVLAVSNHPIPPPTLRKKKENIKNNQAKHNTQFHHGILRAVAIAKKPVKDDGTTTSMTVITSLLA